MNIEPVSEKLGALVTNVRLSHLAETQFLQVLSWWHQYAVLVFPNQHLSSEEQQEFTKRFGRLERGLRRSQPATAGMISNIDSTGNLLPQSHIARKFNVGNSVWHTDSSYKRVAAKASLLSANIVPSSGGHTEWADMRQGYTALDQGMQKWLTDKVAIHSYRFSHAWHKGLEFLAEEDLDQLPPVQHPVIKVHPVTNDRILFVGRHASHILGEDFRSSRRLLRELTFEAAQEPRIWRHQWEVGDIAIWDNRCVLHRARRYPHNEPRAMRRTTVAGDDPTNEWAE